MTRLKIATWNIRKCVGLDRRRDPMRVASVLNDLGADIVALQEADRRLGPRPAALARTILDQETDLVAVDVAQNPISLGWHGNAVLLSDRVTVLDISPIDLPGLEPRGAVVVKMRIEDVELQIAATHLGLARRSRRQQLDTISSAVESTQSPTFILGDFNEWSSRKGLEPLKDFEVHAPGRSFHAARPVAALDRIAARGNIELTDAGVMETAVTRIASDHLPVWGQFSLTG